MTYNGSKCNSYLYFGFYGEQFDVDKISKELKIIPTQTRIRKEPIPKMTTWKYRIDAGEKKDVRDEISEIVNLFYPKIRIINQLKKELGIKSRLQLVLDIDISPSASTPCFSLNQKTIGFLGATGTEVDFDLYKADTIGLVDILNSKK